MPICNMPTWDWSALFKIQYDTTLIKYYNFHTSDDVYA